MDEYPLQSYKNKHYLVWRKYVESITIDREVDIQRKQTLPEDRFDYYIKLIDKLDALRRY